MTKTTLGSNRNKSTNRFCVKCNCKHPIGKCCLTKSDIFITRQSGILHNGSTYRRCRKWIESSDIPFQGKDVSGKLWKNLIKHTQKKSSQKNKNNDGIS